MACGHRRAAVWLARGRDRADAAGMRPPRPCLAPSCNSLPDPPPALALPVVLRRDRTVAWKLNPAIRAALPTEWMRRSWDRWLVTQQVDGDRWMGPNPAYKVISRDAAGNYHFVWSRAWQEHCSGRARAQSDSAARGKHLLEHLLEKRYDVKEKRGTQVPAPHTLPLPLPPPLPLPLPLPLSKRALPRCHCPAAYPCTATVLPSLTLLARHVCSGLPSSLPPAP